MQARQEVNAMPHEQMLIQQYEVWFANAKEFQGRQAIRSDDDSIASLLCKRLTKLEGSSQGLLSINALFYAKKWAVMRTETQDGSSDDFTQCAHHHEQPTCLRSYTCPCPCLTAQPVFNSLTQEPVPPFVSLLPICFSDV